MKEVNPPSKVHTSEEQRRFFEFSAMIVIAFVLIGLSRLEARLFDLSKSLASSKEFLTTVVHFGFINLNIIFILILSFLILRNITKLVMERRRGVLGSRLRTKLIVTLVFFGLAPTILMFYISSQFITTSFDTWFSAKVRDTMQQTREAGAQVYKQDQRRLESLARIALQKIRVTSIPSPEGAELLWKVDASGLKGFESEYGLESVRVFNREGKMLWPNDMGDDDEKAAIDTALLRDTVERFANEPGLLSRGAVEADDKKDIVKGFAPIYLQPSGQLVGVIVAEEQFETQILRSIETILAEFASLRPGAQLIRLSYTILLILMVFIIGFSTTWLGFYVARAIVNPIQSLSEAMREVAVGNYNVSLPVKTDDETGALVKAFERMITDLKIHEEKSALFTEQLQVSNDELDRRHHYMQVVLRNITAGVISIDADNTITSFNSAAERLLELSSENCIGKRVGAALGPVLTECLWDPVNEGLEEQGTFNGQLKLDASGRRITLLVAGIRISDEHHKDLGVVLVFDDATEQARAQRVAAWREVARRIAHEIKNPITPIKLSAERLLRRYGKMFEGQDREVFETCISTILTQVDSLRDLVNEFSKFSRMPTIRKKPGNLNVVVKEVISLFSVSYPEVQFDTQGLDADLPDLQIDSEQINRLLVNLVTNSIAAFHGMEPPHIIEFKTKTVKELNALRLEICDNGCGVQASEKDRVFEPYYSTKKEGTGLGLAIVNQIVNDHGGYIRLGDQNPRGTRIIIDFPMGDDDLVNLS